MNEWDPVSEHQAGVLCNEGFMKEHYDARIDELIRTFTPKGTAVVKDILKDPKYQKIFMQILYHEIKDLPREAQVGVVNELKGMLTKS
jgi:hypothetical protein